MPGYAKPTAADGQEQQAMRLTGIAARKLEFEFHKLHWETLKHVFKTGLRSEIDWEIPANRVSQRFCKAIRTDEGVFSFVRENGVQAFRRHPYWKKWIKWETHDALRRFYAQLPSITSKPERLFLRIAVERADGILFPLHRQSGTGVESVALKTLMRSGHVEESRSTDAEPAFRTTGAGDRCLRYLLKLGFLKEAPAAASTQAWKRSDLASATTLQATRYAVEFFEAGTVVPFDVEQEENGMGAGEDALSPEEAFDEKALSDWISRHNLADILNHLANCGVITERDCRIYLDRKAGHALSLLAESHRLSTSQIHRIETKIDAVFAKSAIQELIAERFRERPAGRNENLD